MAAVPSALVLNPADPAHRGAEWIQRLEEHHRGLTDAEAGGVGLGGYSGFKLALYPSLFVSMLALTTLSL